MNILLNKNLRHIGIPILMLLSASLSYGQQCWKSINTITTDWRRPESNNHWDWTQDTAMMYISSISPLVNGKYQPIAVTLPMWPQSTSTLNNDNLDKYQAAIPDLKDHHPEDGWELIVREFGASSPVSAAVNCPMYALYNKYLSKIRVFYCRSNPQIGNNDKNGTYVSIQFGSQTRQTALLQHTDPVANTVKYFTVNNTNKVPNFYLNQPAFYWMYADFPVAYDPGTCILNNRESIIKFGFSFITSETITATIEGSSTQEIVKSSSSGTSTPASNQRINGLTDDLIGAGKKGYETYKDFAGYKDGINKGIDAEDGFYKGIVNDQIAKQFPTGIDINGKHYNPTIDDLKKTDDGTGFLSGFNYSADDIKNIKSFTSIIPYVGFVWGVYDFFTTLNKKPSTTSTTPPSNPIVSQTNLKLNGTISNESTQDSKGVFTPGTKFSQISGVPKYNNILGVVNVLNIPNLEFAEYKPKAEWNESFSLSYNGFLPNIRQYHLQDELKYVVNPASNMEIISAEAAYILEFDDNIVFGMSDPGHDVDQMPVEFGDYNNFLTKSPAERMIRSGWEVDYLTKDYFTTHKGVFRIRTKYVPLQCFKNMSFNLFNHIYENPNLTDNNICCRNRAPKIMVKIVFVLKRKDASMEPYTYVLTFDLSSQKQNASNFNPNSNLSYYIQRVCENGDCSGFYTYTDKLKDPAIFPSPINGADIVPLSGVVTTSAYSRDEVTITNATFNNNVNVYAGREIDIYPNTIISQTNNFIITPVAGDCSSDIKNWHESDNDIVDIINSTEYTNRSNYRRPEDLSDKTNPQDTQLSNNSFDIYPNPTNGIFTLKVNENQNYLIEIRNLLGEVVYSVRDNHNIQIDLDLSTLSKGIYFIKLEQENLKPLIKKLVIQ